MWDCTNGYLKKLFLVSDWLFSLVEYQQKERNNFLPQEQIYEFHYSTLLLAHAQMLCVVFLHIQTAALTLF